MNTGFSKLKMKVLRVAAAGQNSFALSGGSALELFYLKHRFADELEFFSTRYNKKEIMEIIANIRRKLKIKPTFKNEFNTNDNAKIILYTIGIKNAKKSLKISFVEDIYFEKPSIKKFNGIRVYAVKHIYSQKIFAGAGDYLLDGKSGENTVTDANEVRDVFDIYMLSKKITPLHIFLKSVPEIQQKGIIRWWRNFSRLDLKLGVINLDIYKKNFDVSDMIFHLDNEINKFTD